MNPFQTAIVAMEDGTNMTDRAERYEFNFTYSIIAYRGDFHSIGIRGKRGTFFMSRKPNFHCLQKRRNKDVMCRDARYVSTPLLSGSAVAG